MYNLKAAPGNFANLVESDLYAVTRQSQPKMLLFGLAGRTVISLCRCGQSANKPFCDGSHGRTGFRHPVAARDLPPPMPKL